MGKVRLSKDAAKLKKMASEQGVFSKGTLPSEAELTLLSVVTTGEIAYCCGASEKGHSAGENPEFSAKWSSERTIAATLIRWLCTNRTARELVDPGGIQIMGARIDNLSLTNISIPFLLGIQSCRLEGNTSFYGFEAPALDLTGSWVDSLNAYGIRIKGSVFLTLNFHAQGHVLFQNAVIGGDFDCTGGKFINPGKANEPASGYALNSRGMTVGGSVLMREGCAVAEGTAVCGGSKEGFRAEGLVELTGAQIGQDLVCDGDFVNPMHEDKPGFALVATGVRIRGTASLGAKFSGQVTLDGAHIGVLECGAGEFVNPSGTALNLAESVVDTSAFFSDKFRALGQAYLVGAQIKGDLRCEGDFSQAELVLSDASTRSFFISNDDAFWPRAGKLYLSGFTYQEVGDQDLQTRLKWLKLQDLSQPYLQLAKVLGAIGDEEGKLKILVAMKDREWSRRSWTEQIWRWPYRTTVAYGYNPIQALPEILGLTALGWVIYRRSYLAGGIAPSEKEPYGDFKKSGQAPDYHTRFSPLLYSLENSLPLVKLGQADKWEPDPSPQNPPAVPTTLGNSKSWPRGLRWFQSFLQLVGIQPQDKAAGAPSRVSRFGTSSKLVRWFLWIQILLGWLLATLFLAGISGIIKKE
jgi:hypothetical protein